MTKYLLESLDSAKTFYVSDTPATATRRPTVEVTNIEQHASRFDFMTMATLRMMAIPGRWKVKPVEDAAK